MRRLLALAVMLMLVIAACGGDDEDSDNGDAAASDDATEQVDDAAEDESEVEPTAEPEPTDEPEPTAEPEPTPEPEPTEAVEDEGADTEEETSAGEVDVEVTNTNYYLTSSDALDVMGELVNNGDTPVAVRDVLITLRNSDGSVLDASSAFSYISLIEPGSSVPFRHTFWESGDEFAEMEVEIDIVELTESDLVDWERYFDFEVIQADWRSGEFSNTVVGEFENIGDQTVELAEVYVAGYDADGALTFVQSTFAERDTIAAGERSPFTIDFLEASLEEPAELRAYVQAWIVVE